MIHWIALDIGGANIKLSDGQELAESCYFPLWKEAEQLSIQLRMLLAQAGATDHLIVTMTGELADCFRSKAEGVTKIIQAVQAATAGRHTRIYLTNGKMVSPQVALDQPELAAASNWHALARFSGRYVQQYPFSLLIDIGSTTMDIIPLQSGKVVAQGKTDTERLMSGELIYLGIERTPLCGLLQQLPYRNSFCPVANELFATTLDAFLLLGDIQEAPGNLITADGRPATKAEARNRISRMICADESTFHHRDAAIAADYIQEEILLQLASSVEQIISRVGSTPQAILLSGHGEFLGRRLISRLSSEPEVISLGPLLGKDVTRCATAFALATLASESTNQ